MLQEQIAVAPSETLGYAHGARSRVRFKVLGFGLGLAAITYLDRVCISIAAPNIMEDLHLDKIKMSYVFSAFSLAYALFEIPTGWWGDRIGTRRVLTRIVCWWSTFTIATAFAFNFVSLMITRFLFGAGEAGAWPNAARTFSRWFPKTERGTAQGIFFMGAHLTGGLTPPLVTFMLLYLNWRTIFIVFGLTGFFWAAAWFRWFRDDPSEHKEVSPQELEHIRNGRTTADMSADAGGKNGHLRWGDLVRSRNVILLCMMYFTQTYGFMFFVTWFPTYLKQGRGFTGFTLSVLAGLPLIFSVAADLFGGLTTDAITRRRGLRIGRAAVGAVSLFSAGLLLITGTWVSQPFAAAILIALAAAASNFLLGASWGTCMDIGGSNAGVVSAAMNTAGQVGGILSPIVFALFEKHAGSWTPALYLTGTLYILGALCWLGVDPRQPVARTIPLDDSPALT